MGATRRNGPWGAWRPSIANPYDTDEQGSAGSCGWADANTFVARLVFHQTSYTLAHRFLFEGNECRSIPHTTCAGTTPGASASRASAAAQRALVTAIPNRSKPVCRAEL
jgi:hypothetical protein